MKLKIAAAAGAALFAVGVELWVMALSSPGWARDVRLCTVALGSGLLATALAWFALLWYGAGTAGATLTGRLRRKPAAAAAAAEDEAKADVEAEAEIAVEVEPPLRRRYDLTWER